MNQKNLKKSSNDKNPILKIRYARGLGDFIACILHSKAIGWLTHIITKKEKPCQSCTNRAQALNVLFPIPFWKMFFKNEEELNQVLTEDLKKSGFNVQISQNKKGFSSSKIVETKIMENINQSNFLAKKEEKEAKYNLVSSGDNFIGDFMIKIEIYKK